jgi:TRAP transporter TAXI family solute receptor
MLVACFAACQTPPAPPKPRCVRLTTGAPGAGFYRLGQALAREYRRVLPTIEFDVRESEGSASNIEAIQHHDADIGLAHANVTYLAFLGGEGYESPFQELRGVAKLNMMAVHVLVRPGSRISRVQDLRGSRLGLGVGLGSVATARVVLNAFGLDLGDVQVAPVRYSDAPARLTDGTLDAHLVTGSDPLEAVTRATEQGARLVELAGAPVTKLHRDYPFFRLAVIPAGTYPGQPAAIHTIGVDCLLICRADLDEDLVHDLTRALFEILPSLSSLELSFELMDVEQAPATPIPLHPGAARYGRGRALLRCGPCVAPAPRPSCREG